MKLFYLFLAIILNIIGQFSLKQGVNLNIEKFTSVKFPEIFMSKYTIIGFMLYGVSAIFWIKAIAKINLNIAYPTLAFGYVIVYFLSAIVFQESIHFKGIIGVFFILVGIMLVHLK